MKRRQWLAVLGLWTCFGILGMSSQAETLRDPNLQVESTVSVNDRGIRVRQVHVFQKEALADLWGKLDTNGNGRISPEEKNAFAVLLRPMYADRSALRVDWQTASPVAIQVAVDQVPDRRPRNFSRVPAAKVIFEADYGIVPAKANLIELSIAGSNALEMKTVFAWDEGFVPLRANMGQEGADRTWTMTRLEGQPASFSLIIHRTPAPR
jgi:hypothetical protein